MKDSCSFIQFPAAVLNRSLKAEAKAKDFGRKAKA